MNESDVILPESQVKIFYCVMCYRNDQPRDCISLFFFFQQSAGNIKYRVKYVNAFTDRGYGYINRIKLKQLSYMYDLSLFFF